MKPAESSHGQPPSTSTELAYRWLPIVEVQPGMRLARPVVGSSGALETLFMAAGSPITANTIAQLIVKGVECVAVYSPAAQDDAGADPHAAAFERRLGEIFGPEPDIHCQALMDALRAAGPLL